jgi:chromate transport protein ChrA
MIHVGRITDVITMMIHTVPSIVLLLLLLLLLEHLCQQKMKKISMLSRECGLAL